MHAISQGSAGKVVDLVDVPGHPKVRGKAVQFYNRAMKIMFLVDAVDFMAQKTDVAEQLYEVHFPASIRAYQALKSLLHLPGCEL